MAEIAILGFGTVGSGVYEVLNLNKLHISKRAGQDVSVKYILDIRDFSGSGVSATFVKDFNIILNDPDIKVVVETMGGLDPSYGFVKNALQGGKSVVTSNKELVAAHGAELLSLASQNNVNFLFEASVGGAIPVIRCINTAFTADEIFEINAILNGTTNYILTKMSDQNMGYDVVLKEAMELGYAERNPENDVCGHDTCRKLAILLSLVTGKQADYKQIFTQGIVDVTERDIAYAKHIGGSVKLLAMAKKENEGFHAFVAPVIISSDSPLFGIDDVLNGVWFYGNAMKEMLLKGRGAGKLPTAGAVVADVVDAVVRNCSINISWDEPLTLLSHRSMPMKRLVRVEETSESELIKLFGDITFINLFDDETAFITEPLTDDELEERVRSISVKPIRRVL